MAELFTNEQHYDFSAGVNRQVSRLMMADNECNWIENGELDKIGSIFKVRGYTQKGATVNTGYSILGMVNATKASTGTRKQIVVCDGVASSDAYTYNPINGVWTPHNLSLTSGSKVEFESFLDGFFMVNFTEATRFNDLTQWSTTTNVTGAAKAKYIKQYLSRLYLGYVVTGGSTYPSKITYSDLPVTTVSPNTLSWNDTLNYFDVSPDDGDVIMGLGENANRLMIFKKNSLYRYDTNSLYKVSDCPGTVSHRSIANIQGWTLYLHSTGLWGYDGTTSQILSRNYKEIFEGISSRNLPLSSSLVIRDHYYLYVGDINNAKTGLKIGKCLLDYDIAKKALTWRSLEDNSVSWMVYPDDRSGITYDSATVTYDDANTPYDGLLTSNDNVYLGTDSGKVMQFDIGNDFNGTDIAFSVETKDYYLGYPAFWKLLQKVVVFTDYGGKALIVQAKCDDNDWITLGKITSTVNTLWFPSATKCQRVRFRLMESSSGDQFSFEGLDIYFTATGLYQ